MKTKSLKSNFIMYSLRIIAGIVITLITLPYISKKLGPENLGKVQYAKSIINYFLLFINVGVPVYGLREVASYRENNKKLTKFTIEMILILCTTTIVVLLIFLIFLFILPTMKYQKLLFSIFGLQILFTFMDLEWFFRGIENQTYITIRRLILEVVSLGAIFILINEKSDYYRYALIISISAVGANFLNFYKLFNYINIKQIKLKDLEIYKHIKPLLIFFSSALAISLFYSVDSIMLGSIVGNEELGYYTLASNIGKMPIVLITAITGVLSPRLCNYIRNNRIDDYFDLANSGLDSLLLFSIPATIGIYFLSPEIIDLFGGNQYYSSIGTLKIYSLLMLVLSIAYFTGSLALTPNKMEKISLFSVIFAGFFNIIFNIIFIPLYKSSGAALGTILSETMGVLIRLYLGRELFKKFKWTDKEKLKIALSSIAMTFYLIILKNIFILNGRLLLYVGILGSIFIYSFSLLVFRKSQIWNIIKKLKAIRGDNVS